MFKASTFSVGILSLFVATTTFASMLERQLYAETSAVFVSKNYDKVLPNDDGRVTVINPKFGSADTEVRYISHQSNLNGLCALYGFGSAVSAGVLASGDLNERTVVINADSQFQDFRSTSASYTNARINSLMCNNTTPQTPSTHYANIFQNDDGSATIKDPYFNFADGSERFFSHATNLNGVCKLYGFTSAVPSALIYSGDLPVRTIVLGEDSKFQEFRVTNSSYTNARINSLMCRGVKNNPVPTKK